MRKTTIQTLALTAIVTLAGCEHPTPFQPRDANHSTGFTDQRIAPNRFRVTFTGNAATPRETVENYLLLRAAQVTLQSGYRWFVFDTRDTQAQTYYHTYYQGFGGFPRFRRFGWYWNDWDYADSYPTTRYDAYAEIVMLTPEQAKSESRALDANDVAQRLAPPMPPRH